MTAIPQTPLAVLYEADEVAWLDRSADLIRAGRTDELDYPNLAEFLTDMAIRERREVKSRLIVLLLHLLKWEYQPQQRSRSWLVTIRLQRGELGDFFTSRTLARHAEAVLDEAYARAVAAAEDETGLPAGTFPADCPYTIDQALTADLPPIPE
jgi:hypothetical protein